MLQDGKVTFLLKQKVNVALINTENGVHIKPLIHNLTMRCKCASSCNTKKYGLKINQQCLAASIHYSNTYLSATMSSDDLDDPALYMGMT